MHKPERQGSVTEKISPLVAANLGDPSQRVPIQLLPSLEQATFSRPGDTSSQSTQNQPNQNLLAQKAWLKRALGSIDLPSSVVAQIFTPREVNPQANYQLLEFLGDAALHAGLIVTVMMAPRISRPCHAAASCAGLASNEFLAKRAHELGFSLGLVNVNPGRVYGHTAEKKLAADIVEAALGAILVDRGFDSALSAVQTFFGRPNIQQRTGVDPRMNSEVDKANAFIELPRISRFEKHRGIFENIATEIGHEFKSLQLLYHAVCPHDDQRERVSLHHHRLQAIGRSMLYLGSTDCLYSSGKATHEASLTSERAIMLKDNRLARFAGEMKLTLPEFKADGSYDLTRPTNRRVLASGLEAILGALYCDGGYDLVHHHLSPPIANWLSRKGSTFGSVPDLSVEPA